MTQVYIVSKDNVLWECSYGADAKCVGKNNSAFFFFFFHLKNTKSSRSIPYCFSIYKKVYYSKAAIFNA